LSESEAEKREVQRREKRKNFKLGVNSCGERYKIGRGERSERGSPLRHILGGQKNPERKIGKHFSREKQNVQKKREHTGIRFKGDRKRKTEDGHEKWPVARNSNELKTTPWETWRMVKLNCGLRPAKNERFPKQLKAVRWQRKCDYMTTTTKETHSGVLALAGLPRELQLHWGKPHQVAGKEPFQREVDMGQKGT